MDSESSSIMDAQFHVLAIDDSIIDRKLIERLLKTSSYRVTALPSVSKALEFLGLHHHHNHHHHQQLPLPEEDNDASAADHQQQQQQQGAAVNLIISDYSMPDMTGYDLLRKIKDSDSFKDIPFVIMSSENIPSRINRCLEQGAQEFFLKPVKMSDVNKLKPYLLRDRAAAKRKTIEDGFLPYRSRSRFINNNNNNNLEMSC